MLLLLLLRKCVVVVSKDGDALLKWLLRGDRNRILASPCRFGVMSTCLFVGSGGGVTGEGGFDGNSLSFSTVLGVDSANFSGEILASSSPALGHGGSNFVG